jgi:hypothetical protein
LPLGEYGKIVPELAGRAAFNEVRQHDHQSALLLMADERFEQDAIVRLERHRPKSDGSLDEPSNAGQSGLRTRYDSELPIERNEADAVPVLLGRPPQRHGAVECVIELGDAIHARRHQAAGIDRDDHGMAPFGLVSADHRSSTASRGTPVDVAGIVSGHVLAKRLEFAAFAPRRTRAHADFLP